MPDAGNVMTDCRKIAILLNGPPRAGKDTGAAAIMLALGGIGVPSEMIKFTRPVKDGTHAAFGLDVAHDHFEIDKDVPLAEFGGLTPRQAYIDFSTRLRSRDGEDAVARLFARSMIACDCEVVVNPDCGNDMEAETVAEEIGADHVIVFRVSRDGYSFDGDCREWVRSPRLRIVDIDNRDGEETSYCDRLAASAEEFVLETLRQVRTLAA